MAGIEKGFGTQPPQIYRNKSGPDVVMLVLLKTKSEAWKKTQFKKTVTLKIKFNFNYLSDIKIMIIC